MVDEATPLVLKTYCDDNDLASLANHLKQIDPGQLHVDAADLASLSSACLQILLSADQTCRAKGGCVTLSNVAPDLEQSLSQLGVQPQRFSTEGKE